MNATLRAERAIQSGPRFNAEEAQRGAVNAADRWPKTDALQAVRRAQRNYLDPVQRRTLMDEEPVALTPSEVAGLLNVAEQLKANNTDRSADSRNGRGLLSILESRGQAPKRKTALPAEPHAAYGVTGPEAGEVFRNSAYRPDTSNT